MARTDKRENKCHDKNFIHYWSAQRLSLHNFQSANPKTWISGTTLPNRKGRRLSLRCMCARNTLIQFKNKRQISVSSVGITCGRIKKCSASDSSPSFILSCGMHPCSGVATWSLFLICFRISHSFHPDVKNEINIKSPAINDRTLEQHIRNSEGSSSNSEQQRRRQHQKYETYFRRKIMSALPNEKWWKIKWCQVRFYGHFAAQRWREKKKEKTNGSESAFFSCQLHSASRFTVLDDRAPFAYERKNTHTHPFDAIWQWQNLRFQFCSLRPL